MSLTAGAVQAASVQSASGVMIGDDSSTCTAARAGTLRWVAARTSLEVCTGASWAIVFPATLGSAATSTVPSCKTLASSGYTQNGLYWVDPDGSAAAFQPTQVYCELTSTDGSSGGWTLVVRGMTSSAHRATGAVGTLTAPTQASAAKLSDAFINALRVAGGGLATSIIRLQNDPAAKVDYFKQGLDFCATCSGSTTVILNTYATYASVTSQSSTPCSGGTNVVHFGVTGWGCHDSFIYEDNGGGFRTSAYEAGSMWVL
jgi:hypothetical protein